LTASFDCIQIYNKTTITPEREVKTRNVKRFDEKVEWRRTKELGVRMRHRKQRPAAVMSFCRLSCQLLVCSHTSTLRWITNRILLGIT